MTWLWTKSALALGKSIEATFILHPRECITLSSLTLATSSLQLFIHFQSLSLATFILHSSSTSSSSFTALSAATLGLPLFFFLFFFIISLYHHHLLFFLPLNLCPFIFFLNRPTVATDRFLRFFDF